MAKLNNWTDSEWICVVNNAWKACKNETDERINTRYILVDSTPRIVWWVHHSENTSDLNCEEGGRENMSAKEWKLKERKKETKQKHKKNENKKS